MASPTQSSLISKLQTSNSTGIHALVSDYLRPFSDIKPSSSKQDQTLIRQLAKRFIPFINNSLSIIPKRLPQLSNSNELLTLEFFDIYSLCLDCLEAVCSQLDSKPFQIYFQRLRLINCFESCNRFNEAEAEGLKLLKRIPVVIKKGKILPEIGKSGRDDKDLFILVVEIAAVLVRCASVASDKENGHFSTVLRLMDEVKPWLR